MRYCDHFDLVAVGDVLPRDESNVRSFLDKSGIQSPIYLTREPASIFDTIGLEEILSNHNLTAAFVTTPHAKHYSQVKKLLENGIHVFVDKPSALHYDEAVELADIARSNNLRLVVGSQRRYELVFDYAHKVIQSGKLGSILNINSIISAPLDHLRGWWNDPTLAGYGAVLWNLAWHSVDTIVYCVQKKPLAVDGKLYQPAYANVESYLSALVHFEDDLALSMTANIGAPEGSVFERLQFWGTKGMLTLDRFKPYWNREPAVVTHQLLDGTLVTPDLSSAVPKAFAPSEIFLKFITAQSDNERQRADSQIISSGEDTLETVHILEAIFQSYKDGKRIIL